MHKTWITIAVVLVVLGLILFVVAMSKNDWDFSKLSTITYQTNTHTVTEAFQNISMETDIADIAIVPSEDRTCRVVCHEAENMQHIVTVQDGTLKIGLVDQRKWYEYIGINFGKTKMMVYLPETEYTSVHIHESTGDVEISKAFQFETMDIAVSTGDITSGASASKEMKIKTGTGDIELENLSAGILELSVTTGDTELMNISCENLFSKGSTGDIELENVVASQTLSIERSTGDVRFDRCDAPKIVAKTSTGHIKGTLLSDKQFAAQTSTGRVHVPQSAGQDTCQLTTDTGNIQIQIP